MVMTTMVMTMTTMEMAYVRHSAGPPNSSASLVLVSPFYRQRNCHPEKLNTSLNVTRLGAAEPPSDLSAND